MDSFKSTNYPGLSVRYVDSKTSYKEFIFLVRAYNLVFITGNAYKECTEKLASNKKTKIASLIIAKLDSSEIGNKKIQIFDQVVDGYAK